MTTESEAGKDEARSTGLQLNQTLLLSVCAGNKI